ncbi:glucosaminidase domain-containing protein [Candidatus Daviesbacteria bacterium]|nr:glucosaminidase domain-containing protein [Candidatus Daviesbacteria bacterium]
MKAFLSKLALLFLTPLIFVFSTAKLEVDALYQKIEVAQEVSLKKLDKEAEILAAYLSKFNSPLQYHAQDFIDAAKEYGVNWKLLPAIAGVESTFGKFIPGGYNAYGWAIYTPDSRYAFKSWRDGIFTVTKGLKHDYIDKGLTEPYSINKRYAASKTWGSKVTFFMNDLEQFAVQHELSGKNFTQTVSIPHIAAISGQLILK